MPRAERYRRDPEKARQATKRYRKKLRLLVLTSYSNGAMACACCGTEYFPFLTLDHINSDGAAHRRRLRGVNKGVGWDVYEDLKRSEFPPGYRVLCWNCNRDAYYNDGTCGCRTSKAA